MAVFIGAYVLTTFLGAGLAMGDWGRRQMELFHGRSLAEIYAGIDPLLYWTLLVSPLILVPAAAYAGVALGPAERIGPPANRDWDRIAAWIVPAAFGALAGYCLYRLARIGHLVPGLQGGDGGACLRRSAEFFQLSADLGYFYFAFAFGLLPVLSCWLLLAALRNGGRKSWALFGASLLILDYFYLLTYVRAPFMVYFLALALMSWEAGVRLPRIALTIGAAAVATFVAVTLLTGCQPEVRNREEAFAARMARGVAFRMAVAFPFYVERYAAEPRPCIPVPSRLWGEHCIPAIDVHSAMYPGVRGFAPAPVHISAFATYGLTGAMMVLALAGFVLGWAGGLARSLADPWRSIAMVPLGLFAYQLSQLDLFNALTGSYGLAWTALPLFMAAMLLFARWRDRPSR